MRGIQTNKYKRGDRGKKSGIERERK